MVWQAARDNAMPPDTIIRRMNFLFTCAPVIIAVTHTIQGQRYTTLTE
jgi:hypothetical protein